MFFGAYRLVGHRKSRGYAETWRHNSTGKCTQLRLLGIVVPNSQNLDDRARYLVFQIRTVAELYRLSNLVPGIGGGIHYLTISPNGVESEGVDYF